MNCGLRASGFRVQGSGFRVQDSGFRVQDSGFRVQGLEFREYRRLDELGAKLRRELGRVGERVLLASAVDLRI